MNVFIDFEELAPDVRDALRKRSVATGRPVAELGRELLSEAVTRRPSGSLMLGSSPAPGDEADDKAADSTKEESR
jgi:hypothetical protein